MRARDSGKIFPKSMPRYASRTMVQKSLLARRWRPYCTRQPIAPPIRLKPGSASTEPKECHRGDTPPPDDFPGYKRAPAPGQLAGAIRAKGFSPITREGAMSGGAARKLSKQ